MPTWGEGRFNLNMNMSHACSDPCVFVDESGLGGRFQL